MMKSYSFKVGGQSFTAQIVEYTETKVVVDLNGNHYEVELSSERPVAPIAPVTVAPSGPVPAPPKPIPIHQRSTHGARSQTQPAPVAPAPAAKPSSAAPGAGDVTAPIPGVVKQILVAVGDEVAEGSIVLILEAMKMENEISARVAGKISEIKVGLGDSVQEGHLLIQIEVS